MSMSNNDGFSLADVAAVTGNGGGGWFGGGDGSFAMLILFLFAIMGGAWGNGGWGGNAGGGAMPYVIAQNTDNDVQRGFDQAAIMGQLSGIQTAISGGFADTALTAANNNASILMAINNLAMTNQQCCCENRAAIADLKYTVATEACADRAAIENATRDLQTTFQNGIQTVLTQMCNDKMDAKNEKIADLQSQAQMAQFEKMLAQNQATILANNEAQTTALERYLAPTPIPAYQVPNPNCCGQNYCSYGA